jgi:hypothetical protein
MLRRKLNLASENHSDFLLEIEVNDLAQLDFPFAKTVNRTKMWPDCIAQSTT